MGNGHSVLKSEKVAPCEIGNLDVTVIGLYIISYSKVRVLLR